MYMKKLLLLFAVLLTASVSFAQSTTQVSGYTKKDGTYVAPYTRTTSNKTNTDNYSTQGNTNPTTGTSGTRAQDYSAPAQNYGGGRTIQTGPRGGQYYINDNGKKVYVPKQ
jgi:hypothetical protein